MHTAGAVDHPRTASLITTTRSVRIGQLLSTVPLLFLTFDTVIKVLRLPMAVEATRELGFTPDAVFAVGVIELLCLALCVLPRTAILGAVLLTGYFGGAIATHIRAGSLLLTHTLFPVYLAVLLWGALWLRDCRLRRAVRSAFGPA